MTFKEKIVKLRKMKGLTQDEFASAVGVSRQAVYKWESGQSYPEAAKLLEIKLLFNVSIDDLLDDSYEVIVPEKKKRKRLTKEEKAEIEKKVEEGVSVTETVAREEAPEKEEEPVTVSAPTVVTAAAEETAEAPKAEEKAAEETAATAVQESAKEETEPAKQPEKQPEKKVGFFGRLFGRK